GGCRFEGEALDVGGGRLVGAGPGFVGLGGGLSGRPGRGDGFGGGVSSGGRPPGQAVFAGGDGDHQRPAGGDHHERRGEADTEPAGHGNESDRPATDEGEHEQGFGAGERGGPQAFADALLDRRVEREFGQAAGDGGDEADQRHQRQAQPHRRQHGGRGDQDEPTALEQHRAADAQAAAGGHGEERAGDQRAADHAERDTLAHVQSPQVGGHVAGADGEGEEQQEETVERPVGGAADEGRDDEAAV